MGDFLVLATPPPQSVLFLPLSCHLQSISVQRKPNQGSFLILKLKMKDIISRTVMLRSQARQSYASGVPEEAPSAPITHCHQRDTALTRQPPQGSHAGPQILPYIPGSGQPDKAAQKGIPERFLETKTSIFPQRSRNQSGFPLPLSCEEKVQHSPAAILQ